MSVNDLGVALWGLVCHLYSTCKTGAEAYRELCFRTQFCPEANMGSEDPVGSVCSTISKLVNSAWYKELSQRYGKVLADVRASNQDCVSELEDLILGLYPNGCSLSGLEDAVSTTTAMCSHSISQSLVDQFVEYQGVHLQQIGVHQMDSARLKELVVENLLIPSLLPSRWWCTEIKERGTSQLLRVGLRAQPPGITFEYRFAGQVRHRSFHIGDKISAQGSTAALAKRIHIANEGLLSEEDVQKYLVRLQMVLSKEKSTDEGDAESPTTLSSLPASGATAVTATAALAAVGSSDSEGSHAGEPQKADVGLLYRDPEKALRNVDLNDADEVTLQEFKNVMNEKFMENVIKPGDVGYVYDKRIDAKPTQKSEWDDSD